MQRVRSLLGGSLLAVGCAGASLPPSAPSALLGQPLPDFALPTLDGGRVNTAELRGAPVVIEFFAEYCEPCQRTLPAAERLHREHPRVAFIGVSVDEYAATARGVAKHHGLSFPLIHDKERRLQRRFGVTELPVAFVADSAGTVRWVGGPAQSERDLERVVQALQD